MSEPAPMVAPSESSMRTTALLMTHSASALQRLRQRQQQQDHRRAAEAAREAGASERALEQAGVTVSNGMPRPIDQATFNQAVQQAQAGDQQPGQAAARKTYLRDQESWAVFGHSPNHPGKYLGGQFAAEADADVLVDFIQDPQAPQDQLAQWEITDAPVTFEGNQETARQQARAGQSQRSRLGVGPQTNPMAQVVRELDLDDPTHRALADQLQRMPQLHPDVASALNDKQVEAMRQTPPADPSMVAQPQRGSSPSAAQGQTEQEAEGTVPAPEWVRQANAGTQQAAEGSTSTQDGTAQVGYVSGDEVRQARAQERAQQLVGSYPRLSPWAPAGNGDGQVVMPDGTAIDETNTAELNRVAQAAPDTMRPESPEDRRVAGHLWDFVDQDGQRALAATFPELPEAMRLQEVPSGQSQQAQASAASLQTAPATTASQDDAGSAPAPDWVREMRQQQEAMGSDQHAEAVQAAEQAKQQAKSGNGTLRQQAAATAATPSTPTRHATANAEVNGWSKLGIRKPQSQQQQTGQQESGPQRQQQTNPQQR